MLFCFDFLYIFLFLFSFCFDFLFISSPIEIIRLIKKVFILGASSDIGIETTKLFLNKGIGINLIDKTGGKPKEFLHKYDGGILEFVKHINQKKPILVNKNEKEVFKKPIYISATKNNVVVDCSFEWNASYSEEVLPFTNNIPQKDGGTHLLGFRSALTRVINKYTSDKNSKKNKITLSGEDIKEGLTAVLSIKMPDPKFSSQTKDKLVSSEIRLIVESIISDKVSTWFDQNPSIAKTVLEKITQAAMARDVARKARDSVRTVSYTHLRAHET